MATTQNATIWGPPPYYSAVEVTQRVQNLAVSGVVASIQTRDPVASRVIR